MISDSSEGVKSGPTRVRNKTLRWTLEFVSSSYIEIENSKNCPNLQWTRIYLKANWSRMLKILEIGKKLKKNKVRIGWNHTKIWILQIKITGLIVNLSFKVCFLFIVHIIFGRLFMLLTVTKIVTTSCIASSLSPLKLLL